MKSSLAPLAIYQIFYWDGRLASEDNIKEFAGVRDIHNFPTVAAPVCARCETGSQLLFGHIPQMVQKDWLTYPQCILELGIGLLG